MKDFRDRRVLITGAASGIGRDLARQFAARGSQPILWDRDEAGLQKVALELSKQGVRPLLKAVDLVHPEAIHSAAQELLDQNLGPHILINNAGYGLDFIEFEKLPLEDLEHQVAVNLWGVVHTTRVFLPWLKSLNQAHLVNISSVFALAPVGGKAAYSMTKSAVRGFSEALCIELKPFGVQVLTVFPGGIKTNIVHNSWGWNENEHQKIQRAKRFEQTARTSSASAARQIIRAMERGKSRLLIGSDARQIDLLSRLLPQRASRILTSVLQARWKQDQNRKNAPN